jgi:hypothetical protein
VHACLSCLQLPTGITVLLSCRDRAKTLTCPLVVLEEQEQGTGLERPDGSSPPEGGTRLVVAEPLVIYSLPGTGMCVQVQVKKNSLISADVCCMLPGR